MRVSYCRPLADDGPRCVPLDPPTAMVRGDAFSCEISRRRLNSFSFSVVNCEDPLFAGGLFSTSILTFSKHSCFRSGFAIAVLASFEDVDDEAEGGFASTRYQCVNDDISHF